MPPDPGRAARLAAMQTQLALQYRSHMAADVAFFEQELGRRPLDRDALRRRAHRIRGAAGSFGFADVGALAHELEEACSAEPGPAGMRLLNRLRLHASLDGEIGYELGSS